MDTLTWIILANAAVWAGLARIWPFWRRASVVLALRLTQLELCDHD